MTSRTQREFVSDVFSKASSKANKFGRRFSLKQPFTRPATTNEPLPKTNSTPQLPPLNLSPLDTVNELRDVLSVSSAPENDAIPASVSFRPHTAGALHATSPVPSTTSSAQSENLVAPDTWMTYKLGSRTPSPSRSSQRSSEEILQYEPTHGSERSSREIMLSRTSSGGSRSPASPKKQLSRDSQTNVSMKRSSRDIVDLAATVQLYEDPIDIKRKHDSGFATQSETSADEDDGTLGLSRPRIFAKPDMDRDVNRHNALHYLIKKTYSAPVSDILASGGKALEVSCSTGVWAKDLKARYPMADVYATDTEQYWQEDGDVSFSTCEHAVLPFPDEYFDFIFIRNAVVRMTALRDVLPEVIRTLKPGRFVEMQEFELPIRNGGKYASELSLKMQERALANFIDLGISSRLSKVLRSCHELDRIKASSLGMPLAWSSVGEQMSEFTKTAILEMANLPQLETETNKWMQSFWEECKLNRAVLNYHIAFAQKRQPPPEKPLPSTPSTASDNESIQDSQRIMTPITTLTDPVSYATGTDTETDHTRSTVISSLALPSPQVSEKRRIARRGSLFAWSK